MTFKRYLCWTVGGAALASVTAASPAYTVPKPEPGDYVSHVQVRGMERSYRLHVPSGYRSARRLALPVIFVFHGSNASASVIERETSFDARADSLGFFVVYPEGERRAWNIGECCHQAFRDHLDEAAFVTNIIGQLRDDFHVDTTRIYSTGYSDGATLSYMLACRIPHTLAAVAGISGTLFTPEPRCALPRPVPVMIVHGTADRSIPYQGIKGGPPNGGGVHFNRSAPGVTSFWVQHDRCASAPESVQHGNVVRVRYECPKSAEVLFYTIRGGAHGWPGGGRGWVFSPLPPTDMSATDTVIRFFFRHRLDEGGGSTTLSRN